MKPEDDPPVEDAAGSEDTSEPSDGQEARVSDDHGADAKADDAVVEIRRSRSTGLVCSSKWMAIKHH